jgi:hypothetical protein
MNNHIITILQNFKKPETIFFKDKECLICLEEFDLESLNIVKLPCVCSNSVYHIDCIVKFLVSGANKNFCPHCKTKYEIRLQPELEPNSGQHVSIDQNVPYIINTQIDHNQNLQTKKFTNILAFHILTNSIMNMNNIIISKIFVRYNGSQELQVLMMFYFCKLFFNYCMFMYARNTIEKIEDCLVYSYIFQTILFGFLIYTLTKIKNDDNSAILIGNNILISFIDMVFRIIQEQKMRNMVIAAG